MHGDEKVEELYFPIIFTDVLLYTPSLCSLVDTPYSSRTELLEMVHWPRSNICGRKDFQFKYCEQGPLWQNIY